MTIRWYDKFETLNEMHHGGPHRNFAFLNGYGASIIKNAYSYGGSADCWEVAVLDSEGEITYETPVTDDVVGWLDDGQMEDTLRQIADLPEKRAA